MSFQRFRCRIIRSFFSFFVVAIVAATFVGISFLLEREWIEKRGRGRGGGGGGGRDHVALYCLFQSSI